MLFLCFRMTQITHLLYFYRNDKETFVYFLNIYILFIIYIKKKKNK